jgi:hypothetical protein
MPGEAELRLRDRLSKLRSTSLLRGARVSGEVEKRLSKRSRKFAGRGVITDWGGGCRTGHSVCGTGVGDAQLESASANVVQVA